MESKRKGAVSKAEEKIGLTYDFFLTIGHRRWTANLPLGSLPCDVDFLAQALNLQSSMICQFRGIAGGLEDK
jgi:hypothetical protein